MAGTARFSALPNLNIGRSRWHMTHDHPTSWQHGKIIPLDCVRVQPGDTFKLDLASLIRMNQPIVPIMDNIRCNIYAFFVPMRLVWDHTKEFFGENTTSAGPQTLDYKIPAAQFGFRKANVYGVALPFDANPGVNSVSHYLGKPIVSSDNFNDSDSIVSGIMTSVLKERGYVLIYNEFFRPQQFISPLTLYKDDTCKIASFNASEMSLFDNRLQFDFGTKVFTCCKQFDYFTSALLAPQYGPSVSVPLGDYAPLGVLSDEDDGVYDPKTYLLDGNVWDGGFSQSVHFGSNDDTADLKVLFNPGASTYNGELKYGVNENAGFDTASTISSNDNFVTNLVANLSTATAASINTLRAAFATQRFLERSNYGTRYHEYIQVHFGVQPPLGLLQIPELIGEHHFNINIQQVLSTAGATDDNTTTLGQPGANSTTGDKCMLFKKAFVEHGYVYVLMTTTHDRHYTSGILRDDLKREMLEFYHPEFATLGDQATKRVEIQYLQNDAITSNVNDVFGYQEHWAEYRYIPSRASGVLDPNASSSMAMWTLTNTYDIDVALDGAFLLEDRSALAQALVTGISADFDYIGDFYFDYDVVRPMPLYSIPGRIDHVGGW